VVLFALFGAVLIAYEWATAFPAKPLATFLEGQARTIGIFLFVFALPSALARRNPLPGLRNFALALAPTYLVQLVPPVAAGTGGWEGAVGAAAGAVNGWMFKRWIMPEYEKRRARESAVRPPDSTDGPGSSGRRSFLPERDPLDGP
jgi:hypothetical protein